MTATLNPTSSADAQGFAAKLRSQTIACRLRLEKLGTRKALTVEQRRQAADPFGADHKALSASKKLLDTRDPAFREVRKPISRAKAHWVAMTTPYPEPGIRLIRKDAVELFSTFMQGCVKELAEAAAQLQAKYPELKDRASTSLAGLFCDADYPTRIDDSFGLEWDFPSIDPPAYLKSLHPEIYAAECRKAEAKLGLAVEQMESQFTEQFAHLVTHLLDRLRGDLDGKPKVFQDSTIENLNTFFERFRTLDIGSSAKLQQLVTQAQDAVKGITAGELRENADARATVQSALAGVAGQIDELMVNKPDRHIELPDDQEAA